MLVSLAKLVFIATEINKSDQSNFIQKGGDGGNIKGVGTVKVKWNASFCLEAACASSSRPHLYVKITSKLTISPNLTAALYTICTVLWLFELNNLLNELNVC